MQQGKAAEEKVSAEPLRPQSGSGAATSASKSQEPFLGVKVRRRSSLNKVFQGDYLELNGNATVLKLLSKHGRHPMTSDAPGALDVPFVTLHCKEKSHEFSFASLRFLWWVSLYKLVK